MVAMLDDDDSARGELRAALARQRGVHVVAEVGRGADLLARIAECPPDVVVLDVMLRRENGLDLVRRLRRSYPAVRVVVLTHQLDEGLLLAALRAGAHGYLDRAQRPGRLVAALRMVAGGERMLPDQRAITHVVREVERLARAEAQVRLNLTEGERDVLELVTAGWSNQGIAERQGCSVATIKRRLARIFQKLQAHDRAGAVAEAQRRGVV
jgi:DNA-binding NarL/FixJ family response regulator